MIEGCEGTVLMESAHKVLEPSRKISSAEGTFCIERENGGAG